MLILRLLSYPDEATIYELFGLPAFQRHMVEVLKASGVLKDAGMSGLYNEGVPGMTHKMLMEHVYSIESES